MRLVARMAFILNAVLPEDLKALTELGSPYVHGQRVSAAWMCSLFLAQTIKWPAAIRYFYNQLFGTDAREADARGARPRFRELALDASAFARAYRETLLWANARDWGDTFKCMSFGLQDAQTGLAVNGVAIGLLKAVDISQQSSVKRRRGKGRAASGQLTRLSLGPAQTGYDLVSEDSQEYAVAVGIIEHMMSQCSDVIWPSTSTELTSFANQLVAWARTVRRHRVGEVGFDGGQQVKHQYKALSFVRAALLIAYKRSPGMFAGLRLGDAQQWLPDQNSHCDALDSKMSLGEVEARMGVPGILASMWLCLVHAAGQQGGQALMRASDRDLLSMLDSMLDEHQKLAEEHGDDSNGFFPMPKNMAGMLP